MTATMLTKTIAPGSPTPDRWRKIATLLAHDLATTVAERDQRSGIPDEEIKKLRRPGLLPLVVPKAFGGSGATWPEAMMVSRTLATADSSAAQLYGYHLLLTVLGQVGGTPHQAEYYFGATPSMSGIPVSPSAQTESTFGSMAANPFARDPLWLTEAYSNSG